ncbi:MAG: hypothetical protein Q8N44_22985 [Rubrivivax sp.]|nr:hypothetical protein [Rubrivivax sp.]
MLRCVLLAAALCAGPLTAFAQMPRSFPAQALRGELQVVQPPEVLVNGQPARLAPGARIRGQNNMLQMSGAIAGQSLLVHYTRDFDGLLRDVWVLTAAEAARKPWPVSETEAKAWAFDPVGQTWSKP